MFVDGWSCDIMGTRLFALGRYTKSDIHAWRKRKKGKESHMADSRE